MSENGPAALFQFRSWKRLRRAQRGRRAAPPPRATYLAPPAPPPRGRAFGQPSAPDIKL
jgi:hypothetical protein